MAEKYDEHFDENNIDFNVFFPNEDLREEEEKMAY